MTLKQLTKEIEIATEEIEKAKNHYHSACFNFGREFRKQRIARGLTGREVAKEVGVVPMHITDTETGRRKPNEKILRYFDNK